MTSSVARILISVLACTLSVACASKSASPALPQPQQFPREHRGHKSYALPAIEIAAMNVGVNLAGRELIDRDAFAVTTASIGRNLRHAWVVDDDPFRINQFGHPYQGAMYHGITRSNGLSYWPSAAYTFAASALWEIAGETKPPSRNDQIASGVAGSFLGEPLFRISRLLLERADHRPGVWRTLASVLASPPTGLNHALVGDPAGAHRSDAVPFSDIRVQLGTTASFTGRVRSASALTRNRTRLALSMDYGHPGDANYRHERPFDYFRIESSVSADGLAYLSTRGLIAGTGYGSARVRGVWGLYGSYDYFAPDNFRFASTAFSFGTTLHAPLVRALVLQSSALVGGGYVAAHAEDRIEDFHYGLAPQALLNLRVIAGRRAALDVTGREYYVSTLGGFGTGQRELIFVGDASLAVRFFRRHGLALTYQLAGRSSDYLEFPVRRRARSTVGVFYTFLGSGGFGVPE